MIWTVKTEGHVLKHGLLFLVLFFGLLYSTYFSILSILTY
jgi:hypothetical protein